MNQIFLESWARPLAFVHVLAAILCTGALTHAAVFTWMSGRKARHANQNRAANFWPAIWCSLLTAVTAGCLAYPTYRIRTRAEFLDAHYKTAAALFDIKENYASVVIVLVVAAWLLRNEPADSQARSVLHDNFLYAAAAITWIIFLTGLWVTLHRGIGT